MHNFLRQIQLHPVRCLQNWRGCETLVPSIVKEVSNEIRVEFEEILVDFSLYTITAQKRLVSLILSTAARKVYDFGA